ncbi:MAG: ABC transporter permease [Candidatus Acidiferrales bacterium]
MMFWRLVFQLLRGSRGRLAVAILAIVSGAAVISALLNLDLGVQNKLTQEFRSLGANVVIAPPDSQQSLDAGSAGPVLFDEDVLDAGIQSVPDPNVVASAPYLYVVGKTAETPIVIVGTWLDDFRKLEPTAKLEGDWILSRDDEGQCLVGRNVARRFSLKPGGHLGFAYANRNVTLRVAGVLDTGGSADNQAFVNLPVAQKLADKKGAISVWQLSVSGAPKIVADYAARLAKALPVGVEVRPIRQITEAEGALLGRIQLLIISMVVLILILTALCVLGTMAALAMERRKDVGLMKSLGGSISRIVGLFLAEVGLLGALGGLLGAFIGVALSYWMGLRVFGTGISPRWEIFPVTIVLMIAVAMAGALPLRTLGNVKPAVILRGE